MTENLNDKIIIYQSEDGKTQLDVKLEGETVWLNTKQMAELFDKEESNIRRHVNNVFKEAELTRENNVHFLHVNGVKNLSHFILLMLLYPLVTVYIATEGYVSANGQTLFLSNILSKAMLSTRTFANIR